MTPTAHSRAQVTRAPFLISAISDALFASSAASPLTSVINAIPVCACAEKAAADKATAETKYFVFIIVSRIYATSITNARPLRVAMRRRNQQ